MNLLLKKLFSLCLYRILAVLILSIFTENSIGQTMPPADISCTSKDLEVTQAKLPAPSSDICACSGTRTLQLGIINKTGSTRTSFAMWGYLVRKNAQGDYVNATGDVLTSPPYGEAIFACASNIEKNKTKFYLTNKNITVHCNETLTITDVILAWTSASPGETCGVLEANPGTINPKCGRVDDIKIDVGVSGDITSNNATCTTGGTITVTVYGGKAKYSISLLGGTTYSNVDSLASRSFTNLSAGDYTITVSDANGCTTTKTATITQPDNVTPPTFAITQPTCTVSTATVTITNYSSAVTYYLHAGTTTLTEVNGVFTNVTAGTIYTLQGQKGGCSAYGDLVTITATKIVPSTPTASVVSPTCSVSTGTISVTSYITGIQFSLNGGDFTNTTGIFSNLPAGDYGIRAQNSDGCISGTVTKTIITQPATPSKPSLQITQPSLCGPAQGSIQVCSPHANWGYRLYLNGLLSSTTTVTTGNPVIFNNLTAGSNPSVTAMNLDGCESNPATCADAVTSCSVVNAARINKTNSETVINIPGNEPTVNAFPNPYNDKIRFIVNSPEAGNGSLELFNLLGQKVRTVYQGKIQEGTQSFEVFIPLQQRSSLIYVMRLNRKQVAGKLLNIK